MDWAVQQRLLADYYGPKLRHHGDEPGACDYGSYASRAARFVVLEGVFNEARRRIGASVSVLEVGCGLGDLADWLDTPKDGEQRMGSRMQYTGLDLCPEMITRAKARWAGERSYEFVQGHLLDYCPELWPTYDLVVANGILYLNPPEEGYHLFERTLAAMWQRAQVGVALMTLSTWGDREEEGKWRADPLVALRFAHTLTRNVTLRHDYLPHDWCLTLWRDPA